MTEDRKGSLELELLREIAKWTRESALPAVRERVVRLLDSDPKKRLYEAMDGSMLYRPLEVATGVNHTVAREWVTQWEAQGIAESGAARPKALFTLRELGIPPAPARTEAAPKKASKG